MERSSGGLHEVDPLRIATRTISGLYDGATTRELDELSIRTAASLIAEEPQYSKLAARLLTVFIEKEVQNQDIHSFSQSVKAGSRPRTHRRRRQPTSLSRTAASSTTPSRGTAASCSSTSACGRCTTDTCSSIRRAGTQPRRLNTSSCAWRAGLPSRPVRRSTSTTSCRRLDYMPSSPTLFNSGTRHPQMSSCYLLDSPEDDLEAIYDRYTDIAKLSKYAGGIGVSFSRVRSQGSLIRGTNGASNGIVPWLKTLDSSVAAVNQGGKRKGAACVYVRSVARRHRGLLGAARQHRRRGEARPQPEHRQLGPRPVHAPASKTMKCGRCSTRR